MDNEKAAKLGRLLFFIGSGACLAWMFLHLTPATLAHIQKSNHMDNGRGVPEEVQAGKRAWQKFVCMDCHTILGDGTQYAPEVGRVAIYRDAEFLKKYIRDPKAINPNTGMPTMAMTEKEAEEIVAFLTWTSKINLPEDLWEEMKANGDPYDPRAYDPEHNPFALSYWPPRPMNADKKTSAASVKSADPLVAKGAELFHKNEVASCASCHKIGSEGGMIGPELTTIGSSDAVTRFGTPITAEVLSTKLVDPAADNPAKSSAMPSYKALAEEERKALVAYMMSLKK